MKFYLNFLLKCLISFFTSKLVVIIFQTWVGYYACILHAPDKYTFLNVLNCTFTTFYLALSSSSLLNCFFHWAHINLLAVYETGILVAMVIAYSVIQLCRSKMILDENNGKNLYELFSCSDTETQESFLGPIMMITSQTLFVVLCFYKKRCSSKPNISRLIEKNEYSCLNVPGDLCTEIYKESLEKNEGMDKESLEKNEGMATDFQAGKIFFSENLKSQVEYTEENINMDENSNKLEDSYIDNENNSKDKEVKDDLNEIVSHNNSKDKEVKDDLNEIVSPKQRKIIKASPRLFRVRSISSNPNKELDSTNSEITSHNDTCLSALDTEEDISLTLLGIEDSASSRSVFSVTDSKQFASEINLGSSSSPRIKNEKSNVSINENLDTSVQFPMDLTPKKSENLTEGENSSDIAGSVGFSTSQHKSVSYKDSENLECGIPVVIKKNREKKFQRMLREFKLLGDPDVEEKFTNAVISFETVVDCNFLEWLRKITKPYNDISKFMKYVVGTRNKEIVEKNLREWIKEVSISRKNIEINPDSRRKFYRDIQLTFMKNDYTFKKLRRDCKKVLNDIEEDLSTPNRIDNKNLAKCYASFVILKDDYEIICEENRERSREEKFLVDYITLDDTLKTKIKPININTELECNREEKVGNIFPEKDHNIDISLEDEASHLRTNINSLNQLDTCKASSPEKYDILSIRKSMEENENADVRSDGTENISLGGSFTANLEKYLEIKSENQEKTIMLENRQNKKMCLLDSSALELNLTTEEKSTSKTECLDKSFNSNPNPSYPISIKAKNKDVYSASDSEEEDDDVIKVFDKIQKSIDEKKSLTAEEAFKKFGKLYYGGNSFLKAKKYIKEKHERNNERRKEQEEIIFNTFKLIHAKLRQLNAKTLGSGRIEHDDKRV